MNFKTTDGKETYKFDACACCNLDTGGDHQRNCVMVRGYKSLNAENAALAEKLFLVAIDGWPEWGPRVKEVLNAG